MRVTDEVLLRGRSKAPLDQLQVLHVEHCSVQALANLQHCGCLHSLYAGHNKLVDISNLEGLPQLWLVDLSANKRLHDLSPLSSCLALGYLNLSDGSLTFKDLVPLHDVHILELHLHGNAGLIGDDDEATYRMIVAALLPNVMSLDGHYITAAERLRSIERYDRYVHVLMHGDVDGYGTTSALWTPPAIAMLHNDGLGLAPAHAKHTEWPRLPLQSLLQLPPRATLHLLLLLLVPLEFSTVPLQMVSDALTINLVGQVDSHGLRALLRVPPYVRVALAFHLHKLQAAQIPRLPDDEQQLWATVPMVSATYLPVKTKPAAIADHPAFQRRCCYVVILLSRSPSFPALSVATSATSPEYEAIKPLLEAAHMSLEDLYPTPDSSLRHAMWMGASSADPSTHVGGGSADELPWNKKDAPRKYDRPWELQHSVSAPALAPTTAPDVLGSPVRVPIKIGEWVEVRRRQYVPILSVSNDNKYVVLASFKGQNDAPFYGNTTLQVAQLLKASHKVWKILDLTTTSQTKLDKSVCGPLHRVSRAHHKSGLPRDAGVPNFDVSDADAAAALDRTGDRDATGLVSTVDGFALNATWDANYVLAPAHVIDVQNYCMGKVDGSHAWSSIEAPSFIDAGQLGNQHIVQQTRPLVSSTPSKPLDAMLALQKDMAALLGRTVASDAADSVFLTSLQETTSAPTNSASSPAKKASALGLCALPFRSSETLEVAVVDEAQPLRRKAGHRVWHAVSAKPQLIVGSVLGSRPPSQKRPRAPLGALPSLSVQGATSRLTPSASVPYF
ncbi:hypothetical protein SPRG_18952 [Saprolegnia parasitica CBS 223.65]|uniref:Uncharacterized protein n=1 Tax=Saprolegnia parasitica (strain CBS 223.65) TaxID=695850 RepID=A0A067D7A2_SAPPC|nr:hypothetical protein SPRG_18952 [Saprolegnia parasitica CBS 223.65]KDO34887.1 hypothetical protein SPRG_18952 [Saprolegnia parasitica CBS 223.65]|eukprot:XP_012194819.1 hypothetical protein SPRG_18952 [Saprolegnia parasitica CBS 223.65]